jgi:ubiquinone biosynthesis protein COQ4
MAAVTSMKKDWPVAIRAVRILLANPDDTVQVFKIMSALNSGTSVTNYHRLIATPEGGRIAYKREELVARLTNREWLAQFAPGTVGAAYRAFLQRTGFSADGLESVSKEVEHDDREAHHPYAWMGRRERDLHDIWHVLTGYQAEDPLGELCLVAFSYAQSKGLGWAFIAVAGALKSFGEQHGKAVRRAVREGYAHGRRAKWLHQEDVATLFAEPLDAARIRLNIVPAIEYQRAKALVATEVQNKVAKAPELKKAA